MQLSDYDYLIIVLGSAGVILGENQQKEREARKEGKICLCRVVCFYKKSHSLVNDNANAN